MSFQELKPSRCTGTSSWTVSIILDAFSSLNLDFILHPEFYNITFAIVAMSLLTDSTTCFELHCIVTDSVMNTSNFTSCTGNSDGVRQVSVRNHAH